MEPAKGFATGIKIAGVAGGIQCDEIALEPIGAPSALLAVVVKLTIAGLDKGQRFSIGIAAQLHQPLFQKFGYMEYILHQFLRIGKHIGVDFLQNVFRTLFGGEQQGFVDMPAAKGLCTDYLAIKGEGFGYVHQLIGHN